MFRKQDPYSYTQFLTLYNNPGGVATPIGLLALDYQVALYNDVQVLNESSVSQPQNQQFILQCTRLIPLSQVGQYLGLAGQIRNGAGFDFFGRS